MRTVGIWGRKLSLDFLPSDNSGRADRTTASSRQAALETDRKRGSYAYSGSDDIDSVAWYDKNSDGRTHEVMTKAPNALGPYDMTGNVWEWCWGLYKGGYYAESPAENPRGTGRQRKVIIC